MATRWPRPHRWTRLLGVLLLPAAWVVATQQEPKWPSSPHAELSQRATLGGGAESWTQASLLGAGLLASALKKGVVLASVAGGEAPGVDTSLPELVASQPACIASTSAFAGKLGDTLVYRARREGDRVWVSYFAYWSTERPWGDEPLWSALVIDAFYSRFLFALPGSQYALYGPGDVEGATVEYEVATDPEGQPVLIPVAAVADDKGHKNVDLSQADIRGPRGRTWLLTNAWSHQLGAADAARVGSRLAREQPHLVHCFSGARLVPMNERIASDFRLGSEDHPRRAGPAWR